MRNHSYRSSRAAAGGVSPTAASATGKRLLAGTLLVVGLVIGVATPASAASPSTKTGKELVECVEKALTDHHAEIEKKSYTGFTNALNDCNKAPSLFTPAPAEMIWGALAFLIVAIALLKFAFPALRKTMTARAEKIRGDLEGAEAARTDAEAERAKLLARAEAEAAEIRQRANEDARLAGERALSDLQAQVAGLSVDLAERIVERNLDRDTQLALVESYIASVGSTGNHGG